MFGFRKSRKSTAAAVENATDAARKVVEEALDAPVDQDPTLGATEFWLPSEQERLRQLGDVHRAAAASGDKVKAKKYERYAGYGSEGGIDVLAIDAWVHREDLRDPIARSEEPPDSFQRLASRRAGRGQAAGLAKVREVFHR